MLIKPIYGLVVCGGQSSRMGVDKSLLVYHGKPQRYYLFDVLEKICDKVFISCNSVQAEEISKEYNVIVDSPKFSNIGPMAALLSAFDKHPKANFLVVGCDYPLIKIEHLGCLIDSISVEALAISYYCDIENIREPLLAVYKSECQKMLRINFEKGKYSLKHFLEDVDAQKIVPTSSESIKSVDTKAGYEETLRKLNC